MTTSPRLISPLLLISLLVMANGIRPANAQVLPNPVIQGFLGDQNSRQFFKEGRIKLDQEIQRLEMFDQLSLEQLLEVNPNAFIQDEEILKLESAGPQDNGSERQS